jgi:hypothetical protein
MAKNQDPGSGIKIPDPQFGISCLDSSLGSVSHQWCDLFSSTTAQLYATHRKRE